MIVQAFFDLFNGLLLTLLSFVPSVVLPDWMTGSTAPVNGTTTLGGHAYNLGGNLGKMNAWLPVTEVLTTASWLMNAVILFMAFKFVLWIYGLVRGGGGQ